MLFLYFSKYKLSYLYRVSLKEYVIFDPNRWLNEIRKMSLQAYGYINQGFRRWLKALTDKYTQMTINCHAVPLSATIKLFRPRHSWLCEHIYKFKQGSHPPTWTFLFFHVTDTTCYMPLIFRTERHWESRYHTCNQSCWNIGRKDWRMVVGAVPTLGPRGM